MFLIKNKNGKNTILEKQKPAGGEQATPPDGRAQTGMAGQVEDPPGWTGDRRTCVAHTHLYFIRLLRRVCAERLKAHTRVQRSSRHTCVDQYARLKEAHRREVESKDRGRRSYMHMHAFISQGSSTRAKNIAWPTARALFLARVPHPSDINVFMCMRSCQRGWCQPCSAS